MTMLSCRCSMVKIEFEGNRDLFRLQCCCHDCSSALWYASERGGPAAPKHQCVDNSWLPNAFTIIRGEQELGAFMNFKDADTTRFYCKQCWTILFGDHPLYAKKLVVTAAINFTEYDGLNNISLMPLQARHFLKDLDADQQSALPPWEGDPANVYDGVADVLIARFPEIQAQGCEGTTMNAQILLQKIGQPLIPDGVSRLTDGPPTIMQQAARDTSQP